MSRLPTVLPQNFTPLQQKLFDKITGGKRGTNSAAESFLNADGGLRGPFNVYLHSPGVGDAAQQLGAALRFEGNLPDQLRELAILTLAAQWKAQYEWWAHERVAREVGLDPDVIAAIQSGGLPDSAEPAHRTVYGFTRELLDQQRVSDERYAEAVDLLGEPNVVELVLLLGYYTLIAMTLNVFEVPLPAGETNPF